MSPKERSLLIWNIKDGGALDRAELLPGLVKTLKPTFVILLEANAESGGIKHERLSGEYAHKVINALEGYRLCDGITHESGARLRFALIGVEAPWEIRRTGQGPLGFVTTCVQNGTESFTLVAAHPHHETDVPLTKQCLTKAQEYAGSVVVAGDFNFDMAQFPSQPKVKPHEISQLKPFAGWGVRTKGVGVTLYRLRGCAVDDLPTHVSDEDAAAKATYFNDGHSSRRDFVLVDPGGGIRVSQFRHYRDEKMEDHCPVVAALDFGALLPATQSGHQQSISPGCRLE